MGARCLKTVNSPIIQRQQYPAKSNLPAILCQHHAREQKSGADQGTSSATDIVFREKKDKDMDFSLPLLAYDLYNIVVCL
jgi:hypothetical protein